jgi:hypothetical protein
MKAPKSITKHPGVETCESGISGGVEDYRYSVWLKPGWVFSSGRNAGGRGYNVNTANEFKQARPTKTRLANTEVVRREASERTQS